MSSRICTLATGLALAALGACAFFGAGVGRTLAAGPLAAGARPKVNKLLQMYRIFYLPFSLEFGEGRSIEDVLPYTINERGLPGILLTPDRLSAVDTEWKKIREEWRHKSLFQNTEVAVGERKRITPHLVSHHVSLTRTALDTVPVTDRIRLQEELKKKSAEVQASFLQIRFARSFLEPEDDGRFNLILIMPSWCESSREYRTLIETYYKTFPQTDLSIHVVVVEDPKREFFDSRLNAELFPNRALYSHENTPRFLAVEIVNGELSFSEEAEALQQAYERFFAPHRGYLDSRVGLGAGSAFTPGSGRDLATPGRRKR